MKKLLTILIVFVSIIANGQIERHFLYDIGEKRFDSAREHLSNKVILWINDDQQILGKGQAVKKIRGMFDSQNIVKFKLLHNGKSADRSSSYKVARIKTDLAMYRVFAYSEKRNGVDKVVEIRVNEM